MTRRDAHVVAAIVTFNRKDLLVEAIDAVLNQTHPVQQLFVVDNASTDDTEVLLEERGLLEHPLVTYLRMEDNLGGAGGFHLGVKAAYDRGFDRIWLMDDDVVPAPDCLSHLMAQDEACLMAVREDTAGRLVEKAALRFDLRNPLAIKPKTSMVETAYGERDAMPGRVELENVAFEGFLVRREVVDAIGLPDPAYFIFYDDVDFAVRARRVGYRIWAIRDAVLVRQLDFDQQHDLAGWKGYYMYRNLFVVHFRYGENVLVRAKPYLVALAVTVLSPMRGGRREAGNVLRAVRDARGMRVSPRPIGPSRTHSG